MRVTLVARHTTRMAQSAPVDERPHRELRGVVERITYQNAEDGFTVARLAPERPEAEADAARDEDRLVTMVDTLVYLTPGDAILASGWWCNDPKRGWLFLAADYRMAPLPPCRA